MIPKVSVIIPIYDVESYIVKCSISLFEQTLDDIEYIFIDDCSTDNSLNILENIINKYPNRKNQIKIIKHSKNEGVAKSRQDGLDVASGEFVIHCDPDDWIELNMYEVLYNKAKEDNSHLVVCDYFVNENNQYIINNQPNDLTYLSILRHIAGNYKKRIIGATWNKLIKNEIAKKGSFPPNTKFCEDVSYLFSLLDFKDIKISYVNKPLYHYNIRENSLVRNFDQDTLIDDSRLIETLKNNYLCKQGHDNNIIEAFIADVIISRLFYYKFSDKKNQLRALRNYTNYFKFNNKQKNINKKLAYLALWVNFNTFNFFYIIYERIRRKAHYIKYNLLIR